MRREREGHFDVQGHDGARAVVDHDHFVGSVVFAFEFDVAADEVLGEPLQHHFHLLFAVEDLHRVFQLEVVRGTESYQSTYLTFCEHFISSKMQCYSTLRLTAHAA